MSEKYQTEFELQGVNLRMVSPSWNYRKRGSQFIDKLERFTADFAEQYRVKLVSLYPTVIDWLEELDQEELSVLEKAGAIEPLTKKLQKKYQALSNKLKEFAEKTPEQKTLILDAYSAYEKVRFTGDSIFFEDEANVKEFFTICIEAEDIQKINFEPETPEAVAELDGVLQLIMNAFFLSRTHFSKQ